MPGVATRIEAERKRRFAHFLKRATKAHLLRMKKKNTMELYAAGRKNITKGTDKNSIDEQFPR